MANKQFNARQIQKHDTEANWDLTDGFIPLDGELIVYDKDNTHDKPRIKIGDGVTDVKNLPFSGSGGGSNVRYEIVQTLPSTGENGVIYLVPKEGETDDIYDEYMYINNAWEKIGSTAMVPVIKYTKNAGTYTCNLSFDEVYSIVARERAFVAYINNPSNAEQSQLLFDNISYDNIDDGHGDFISQAIITWVIPNTLTFEIGSDTYFSKGLIHSDEVTYLDPETGIPETLIAESCFLESITRGSFLNVASQQGLVLTSYRQEDAGGETYYGASWESPSSSEDGVSNFYNEDYIIKLITKAGTTYSADIPTPLEPFVLPNDSSISNLFNSFLQTVLRPDTVGRYVSKYIAFNNSNLISQILVNSTILGRGSALTIQVGNMTTVILLNNISGSSISNSVISGTGAIRILDPYSEDMDSKGILNFTVTLDASYIYMTGCFIFSDEVVTEVTP